MLGKDAGYCLCPVLQQCVRLFVSKATVLSDLSLAVIATATKFTTAKHFL